MNTDSEGIQELAQALSNNICEPTEFCVHTHTKNTCPLRLLVSFWCGETLRTAANGALEATHLCALGAQHAPRGPFRNEKHSTLEIQYVDGVEQLFGERFVYLSPQLRASVQGNAAFPGEEATALL